jgi:hypothetical protein
VCERKEGMGPLTCLVRQRHPSKARHAPGPSPRRRGGKIGTGWRGRPTRCLLWWWWWCVNKRRSGGRVHRHRRPCIHPFTHRWRSPQSSGPPASPPPPSRLPAAAAAAAAAAASRSRAPRRGHSGRRLVQGKRLPVNAHVPTITSSQRMHLTTPQRTLRLTGLPKDEERQAAVLRVAAEELAQEGVDIPGHLRLVVHGHAVRESRQGSVCGVERVCVSLHMGTSWWRVKIGRGSRSLAYPVPAGWSR